jgi:hypothetical protein
MVIVEKLVKWRFAGETEVLGENLTQPHYVHHKSHMTRPGFNMDVYNPLSKGKVICPLCFITLRYIQVLEKGVQDMTICITNDVRILYLCPAVMKLWKLEWFFSAEVISAGSEWLDALSTWYYVTICTCCFQA